MYADTSHAVIISGPAETGKTFGALYKVDTFLRNYAGAQVTIARKVRASMYGSVLRTYDRVRAIKGRVTPYGGQQPEWYDYANGSRLWVAGLDNPGKALSSERDMIYINQAEELTLEDWETLATRATGRGAVAPWTQMLGDCNPSYPTHWIKHKEGLAFYESRHEDNPTLYTADGQLTDQGVRTMSILDALTGVRYRRLRLGQWAAAEGAVYEGWDAAVHLIDPFPIPSDWRRIRSIDFGFVNPFSCGWFALDHDDNLYLYREIYMTGRTVAAHAAQINALSEGEHYEVSIADHDAEDRATLEAHGIYTVAARKDVSPGIQAVQERLRVNPATGRAGLYIFRDSLVELDETLHEARKPTRTAEEFDGYVWQKGQDGRPLKEQPTKLNDHGLDMLRYAVMTYGEGFGTVSQDIQDALLGYRGL